MARKKVVVLTTGGTIATKSRGGVMDVGYAGEQLIREFPELKEIAEIEVEEIMNVLSENMNPFDWQKIARKTRKHILRDDIDGIVITHGTDTLTYTAGALALILQNLNKPIVITGSMVSIEEDKNHIRRHLVDSIFTAAYSNIAEVLVCFSGDEGSSFTNLYRGSRVRDRRMTTKHNAFESPWEGPVARIQDKGMVLLGTVCRRQGKRDLIFNDSVNPRVHLAQLLPGLDMSFQCQLENCCKSRKDGVVIVAYSGGSFLDNHRNTEAVKKALSAGVSVAVASEGPCAASLTRFDSDRWLKELGAIPLGDMLFEKAVVKLMWVLAQTKELKEVKEKMQFNFAGEITPHSYLASRKIIT